MSVRPAKTPISLGIRPVWSESSLCAQWIAKDPSFLHADSKDSDLRLCWAYMPFCWFCHEAFQLFILTVIYVSSLGHSYAPINVFPQSGEGRITPRELENFEKLGSYPCDTILCQKSPECAFKFRHNFFEIFSLKHLRSRPWAKVVCQIPEGSDCFGSLIPRVSPPPLPLLGKTLVGALYIQITSFYASYEVWSPLNTEHWHS